MSRFSIDGYQINTYTRKDKSLTVTIRHPNVGYFQPWFSLDKHGAFIKESGSSHSLTRGWIMTLLAPSHKAKKSPAYKLYDLP